MSSQNSLGGIETAAELTRRIEGMRAGFPERLPPPMTAAVPARGDLAANGVREADAALVAARAALNRHRKDASTARASAPTPHPAAEERKPS